MKTVLWVLLGLVTLLAAALLAAPSFIDWTAHKDRITAQIENATGRAVTIQGDLELSLLPRPTFSAEGISLANLPGGSRAEMARARGLRIELAVTPLLQGSIQVRQIILVEPDILLEVLPGGRRNWTFGEGESEAALSVSLESLRIVRGDIAYHDAGAGILERISDANLELTAESLQGPFTAEGRFSVEGAGLKMEAALGRLGRKEGTSFNLALTMPGGDAELSLTGVHARAIDGAPDSRATLRLEGSNLGRSLSLAGLQDVPGALEQGYRVAGTFRLDGGGLHGEDLDLRLGENTASADMHLSMGAPMEGTASLSIQRLNLDTLLAMGRESGLTPERADGGFDWNAVSFPEWLEGALDLEVGALIYRGQIVRQGHLRAELTEGTLRLREAAALLPGGGALNVSGRAASENGEPPSFVGRVEANADNLRGLFSWLDVPVEDVPSHRLRRLNLFAEVQGTPRQFNISNLDVSVDATQVTGGVVVALRSRPAFGIGLSTETLDLDSYLGDSGKNQGLGLPDAWMDALGSFDANFDLRAGSVEYLGETARDVALNATLQQGGLTIRRATLGDLADSRIAFAGTLDGLTGEQASFDGTVEVETREARSLLRLLGQESLVPPDLGPMTLEGALQGGLETLGIDLRLAALDGIATASGEMRALDGPLETSLSVRLRHGTLAGLLSRLGHTPAPNAEELGGVDLSAQLRTAPGRIEADGLSGTLGPLALSGQIAADTSQERPMLTVNLDAEEAALPLLLGAFAERAAEEEDSSNEGLGPQDVRRHWSDSQIDFSALQSMDADLTLRADALRLTPELRLENAAMNAGLRNGVLDIERFAGTLHGGEVTLGGTLDSNGTPTLGGRLRADGLETGRLGGSGFLSRVSGPLDLDAQFNARGGSERALLRSLSGAGTLSGTLTLEPSGGDGASGPFAELFPDSAEDTPGLADADTAVAEAFAGESAALTGRFAARNGVFVTDDLTLRAHQVRAVLSGEADLPNWRTQARIDFFHQDDPGEEAFLTARLTGPLDAPTPEIEGAPFRPAEPGSQAKPEAPAIDFESLRQAQEPEDKEPEDKEPEAPPQRDAEAEADAAAEDPGAPPDALDRPSAEDIIREFLGEQGGG